MMYGAVRGAMGGWGMTMERCEVQWVGWGMTDAERGAMGGVGYDVWSGTRCNGWGGV